MKKLLLLAALAAAVTGVLLPSAATAHTSPYYTTIGGGELHLKSLSIRGHHDITKPVHVECIAAPGPRISKGGIIFYKHLRCAFHDQHERVWVLLYHPTGVHNFVVTGLRCVQAGHQGC